MQLTDILWIVAMFVVIQFLYMKVLSRGKVTSTYIKKSTVYKIIALSVMLVVMNFVDYKIMFIALLGLYTFIIIKWIYNIIKGRDTALRLLLFIGVYIPIFLGNFVPKPWNAILMTIGVPMSFLFLWHTYKNPYYNACWLDTVITEITADLKKNCNYTSRPIIIEREIQSPFIVTYRGIKIWFKKERTVFKISEKYFNKLGKPELKKLSERVCERILSEKFKKNEKDVS